MFRAKRRSHTLGALSLVAVCAGLPLVMASTAVADPPDHPGVTAGHEPRGVHGCRPQSPQEFLIRRNYVWFGRRTPAERAARQAAHRRAVRYRTENYGYFEGFGDRSLNAHAPRYYSIATRFMGLPVRMHRRVVPALQCVEEELRRSCTGRQYRPHALAGIRFQNTYHTGEITNHAYGIAIDIDPDRNTCCHCVGPWARHPLCRRRVTSRTPYDRMAMPECWVRAFRRYGFYWLGDDVLQDTMHFEFLGDPSRIVRGG